MLRGPSRRDGGDASGWLADCVQRQPRRAPDTGDDVEAARRRRGRRRRRASIQGILGARPAGVSGVPDRRAPHPAGFRSDRIQGSRRQVHGAARQRRRLRHSRPPHEHPRGRHPIDGRAPAWLRRRHGVVRHGRGRRGGGRRREARKAEKQGIPKRTVRAFRGQKEGPRSPARRYARRAGAKTRNAARRAAAKTRNAARRAAARRRPPRRAEAARIPGAARRGGGRGPQEDGGKRRGQRVGHRMADERGPAGAAAV